MEKGCSEANENNVHSRRATADSSKGLDILDHTKSQVNHILPASNVIPCHHLFFFLLLKQELRDTLRTDG